MKKIALFLAVTMLLCSLCACGGATGQMTTASDKNPSSSGANHDHTITVGIAQDLDNSLDPYRMSAAGTREVMFNVYEGLVKPDKDGNYVCAVASDYQVSEDGLVYTFTLRENVKFHNGADCTPADVLYSYETCAANTVNSAVQAALSAVSGYEVEGNAFIVTLQSPNPDFLSYVSSVYIAPKDYADGETKPVGTGPFKFVSRSVQENFIIERHDDYYGEKAKLDRVTYKIYEDGTALFTALDSGALDLVAHLSVDQVNTLTNGYDVLEGTMNLVQALYLNHNVAPFDNELVRKALCHAMDREALLAITAEGHGTPLGSSMYPAFGKYFDAALADAYPFDVEKAKELLAEAGYPDGFSFTVKVPSNYQPHVDAAIVLAEQFKAVGVQMNIQQVDWETWVKDVYGNRNFEGTVCGFDASTLNASALLARWQSDNGKNMINYANPDYDAAYAAAMSATDDAEQTASYKECLQLLSDTAANVYIQDLADFVAISPDLEGYEFYPLYVIDMAKIGYRS